MEENPSTLTLYGEAILPDVAESIQNKMKEKNIEKTAVAGVGVGVPGPVDDDGIVHVAVNLGWGVFNVSETLSGLLDGMEVKAGNDANVAALGEMKLCSWLWPLWKNWMLKPWLASK